MFERYSVSSRMPSTWGVTEAAGSVIHTLGFIQISSLHMKDWFLYITQEEKIYGVILGE
jgi:hypothetical protein